MVSVFQSYPQFCRILICGFGSIGRRHARILHKLFPCYEISVLRSGYGIDAPELSFITSQFSDLESALSWGPDASFVCSPAPFHQQQALSLATHGIPVFIDKPIGTGNESQDYWDHLLHLSKDLPVVVGYVFRHDPCAQHIKNILNSNILGKVIEADFYCGSWLPDWRPDVDYRSSVSSRSSMGGGALLELSHEIDLAIWIFREFQLSHSYLSQSNLLDIDVEDQVLLVGSSLDSSLITIRLNMCTKPSRRTLLIRCEKGELHWDLLKGNVDLTTGDHNTEVLSHSLSPDDRFSLQTLRFLDCIYNSGTPYCSLDDGLKVLNVINHAHASSCH